MSSLQSYLNRKNMAAENAENLLESQIIEIDEPKDEVKQATVERDKAELEDIIEEEEREEKEREEKERKKRMRQNKKAALQKTSDSRFAYFSVATVMLPGFTVGTVMGWEYIYTMRNDSYVVSVPFAYIGAAVGAIIASEVMLRCGRHVCLWSLFWCIYLQVIVRLGSDDVTLTCILRFFGGLSVGAYYMVVPIYIAELVYRRHRGIIVAALGCKIAIGVIASGNSFVSSLWLLCDILFGIAFIVAKCFYAPESPYYQIANRRYGRAITNLKKCRNSTKETREIREIALEVATYPKDVTQCIYFTMGCCDLNIEINHRTVTTFGLLLLPLLMFVSCHLGFNLDYYTDGYTGEFFVQILIVLLAFLVNVFVIDKYGRKILLMISSIGVTLLYLILFVLYCVDYERRSSGVRVVNKLIVFFFYLGLDFIPFLYFSELFPYIIRSAGNGCILVMYFIACCLRPVSNFYFLIYLDYTIMTFAYFLIALASVFFCWFIPTETKQMSLCEIQIKMDFDVDILERQLYLN